MKISRLSHDWTFCPRTSHQTELLETSKTQILKNILSIFRDWGIDSPVSREKIFVWAHNWDMRLDQSSIESPKQDSIVFENFDIFVKTKDFPKTAKTLKNIFVFDQQGLNMRKHI